MSALPAVQANAACDALRALSALTDTAVLIQDPGVRLQGLAALLVAVTAWGGCTRRLRRQIEACRTTLSKNRRLRGAMDGVLDQLLDNPTPDLPARLARLNASQRRQDPRWLIASLLDMGLVDAARQAAEALPQDLGKPNALRTRAIRLAQTGLLHAGGTRRFVPDPRTADRFPASLPVLSRCISALLGSRPDPQIRASALRILGQLSERDRQAGLALWCLVRWREEGEEAAVTVLRSIRYRSRRAEAGLRLVEIALQDGDREAAIRLAMQIPTQGGADQAAALLSGKHKTAALAPIVSLSMHRLIRQLDDGAPIPTADLDEIRRWQSQGETLSALTRAMEGSRRPLIDQVRQLHTALGGGDRLWCAVMLRCGARLAATAPAQPRVAPPPATADALSPERAAWDEWRALRPEGHAHRRVLARACRAALKVALRRPLSSAATRLRTLGHIGGSLAVSVLTELYPEAEGPLRDAILRQLLATAPARLARMLSDEAEAIPDALMQEILDTLELHRKLAVGTAAGWRALSSVTTPAWRREFLPVWRRLSGSFPDPLLLRSIVEEVRLDPTQPPARLLQEAQESLSALKDTTPTEAIDLLLSSPLLRHRLRWSHPAALPGKLPQWDDARLVAALKLARRQGSLNPGVLDRSIHDLVPQIRASLIQGRCPLPALSVLTVNERTRLRYLDKKMDLLTFFRFADPTACCWNSTGRHFGATQARLLSVWKDPLSFCFHLGRLSGSGDPLGFVFGSLARCGEAPAAVLNGLYLTRQLPSLRSEVLAALERFFHHLGVRWLGVACRYNGYGTMPDRYQLCAKMVHRPRALSRGGVMVTQAVDDVSIRVNHTQSLRLFWIDLGTPVSSGGQSRCRGEPQTEEGP